MKRALNRTVPQGLGLNDRDDANDFRDQNDKGAEMGQVSIRTRSTVSPSTLPRMQQSSLSFLRHAIVNLSSHNSQKRNGIGLSPVASLVTRASLHSMSCVTFEAGGCSIPHRTRRLSPPGMARRVGQPFHTLPSYETLGSRVARGEVSLTAS